MNRTHVDGQAMTVPLPGGEILVYEAADGGVRVEVKLDRETVWLTQRADGRYVRHIDRQRRPAPEEQLYWQRVGRAGNC